MLPDLTSALMGGFPNLTSADKGGRGVQNPKKCADIICERPLMQSLSASTDFMSKTMHSFMLVRN